jgi:hypothetical protein
MTDDMTPALFEHTSEFGGAAAALGTMHGMDHVVPATPATIEPERKRIHSTRRTARALMLSEDDDVHDELPVSFIARVRHQQQQRAEFERWTRAVLSSPGLAAGAPSSVAASPSGLDGAHPQQSQGEESAASAEPKPSAHALEEPHGRSPSPVVVSFCG